MTEPNGADKDVAMTMAGAATIESAANSSNAACEEELSAASRANSLEQLRTSLDKFRGLRADLPKDAENACTKWTAGDLAYNSLRTLHTLSRLTGASEPENKDNHFHQTILGPSVSQRICSFRTVKKEMLVDTDAPKNVKEWWACLESCIKSLQMVAAELESAEGGSPFLHDVTVEEIDCAIAERLHCARRVEE